MRENSIFPVLWDITLVKRSGLYNSPGRVQDFLSLKLFALGENHNSSIIEFSVRNKYGNRVEGKKHMGMPEVSEIAGYAARLAERKNNFTVEGVFDTSDGWSEILITVRNGLVGQNKPLSFYISMQGSGFAGSDAPLTKEFLRCLSKLTNQEIPHYLT